MKLLVFSVFDEKAQAYLTPFYLPTVATAVRAMTDCINDRNHQFHAHTADYSLFELGSFDDSNGVHTCEVRSIVHTLLEIRSLYCSAPSHPFLMKETPPSKGTNNV